MVVFSNINTEKSVRSAEIGGLKTSDLMPLQPKTAENKGSEIFYYISVSDCCSDACPLTPREERHMITQNAKFNVYVWENNCLKYWLAKEIWMNITLPAPQNYPCVQWVAKLAHVLMERNTILITLIFIIKLTLKNEHPFNRPRMAPNSYSLSFKTCFSMP